MTTLLQQIRDIIQIENQKIFKRIDVLEKGQDDIKADVKETRLDMIQLTHGIKRIEKKFDDLFDFLDKDWSQLKRQTARIERHLDLQPLPEAQHT